MEDASINKLKALGYSIFTIRDNLLIARNSNNIYLYKDNKLAYDFIKEYEKTGREKEVYKKWSLRVYEMNLKGYLYIEIKHIHGDDTSIFIDSNNNILVTQWFYENEDMWIATTEDEVLFYNKQTGFKRRIKKIGKKRFGRSVAMYMRKCLEMGVIDNKYILVNGMLLDLYENNTIYGINIVAYKDFLGMSYSSFRNELYLDYVYIFGKGIYRVVKTEGEYVYYTNATVTYIDGDGFGKIVSPCIPSSDMLEQREKNIKSLRLWQRWQYVNEYGQTDCELNLV